MNENMGHDDEDDDSKVGYRKPPKSGQFKKGVSGNPSGRPKRPSDFNSELMRELNERIVINENGKRRVIKMSEASAKQLVRKAASGSFREQRLLASLRRDMMVKAAEQQLNLENQRDIESLPADQLTDEELLIVLVRSFSPQMIDTLVNLALEDARNRATLSPGEADSKTPALLDLRRARLSLSNK